MLLLCTYYFLIIYSSVLLFMSSTLHVVMLLPQAEGKRGTRDEQLWEDRVIHSLKHSIQITHQDKTQNKLDFTYDVKKKNKKLVSIPLRVSEEISIQDHIKERME